LVNCLRVPGACSEFKSKTEHFYLDGNAISLPRS
jgi:hypothetical protein